MIPLFILVIALLPRVRIQTVVGFLLLFFWVPAGFPNWLLYLFEILLYGLLILLVVENTLSDDEHLRSFLTHSPWFPFILYICGALLTWLFSTKTGGELNTIRAMCIIPLALSAVIFLTTRSTEDAERFLWMVLTSAAVLALFVLVGEKFSSFISFSNYAAGSGRLSMRLYIPHVGFLEMLPQSIANWFGFLLVFAYSLWIFHPSFWGRTYAFFLCLLYGYLVISSQGRGGALQAAMGAMLVSVYAAYSGKIFRLKGMFLKFAVVCLVVIGGFWYLATQSTNEMFQRHGTIMFVNPMEDENLVGRIANWIKGIELYLANPILGTGLRGIETPWGLDTSEILNYFLFNLLSYGVLGFLAIMTVHFRLLTAYWRGIQLGDRIIAMLCIASMGAMLGFLLGVQPQDPYSTVIVWAPLLIAFAASAQQRNRMVLDSGQKIAMRQNSYRDRSKR
jgi:hypothetical protein